jgi:GNAT superfamily N-acetyltransferase
VAARDDRLKTAWRPMRPDDIPAVYALSRRVHTDHPEREAVLAEKLTLFPAGCFVLEADGAGHGGRIVGYAFSHPWVKDSVPSLDTFLTALPDQPTMYFIHDVTLDESMRGQGHAAKIVPVLVDAARGCGLTHMMLVAVNGAEVFWQSFGFSELDAALRTSVQERYGARATLMERNI